MATQEAPQLEGILLIDKPQGPTSHDVVDRVRRKLKMKRIGHAGTLDPNATGLLIILVGKATKVSQYLMSLDKEYQGEMKLGETTDSYDVEGEITETKDVPTLTEDQIKEVFKGFVGDQYQTPPMFSAKKIDGVPLYKLARKGKEVKREPRFIRINELALVEMKLPMVHFYVSCTKGTYIRTLAHDIGQKLECGAHLTDLRRISSDKFDVDDAVMLEDFEDMSTAEIKRHLIPIYQAVPSHVL